MNTSAEQIHNGKLNLEPQKGGKQILFVDLDVCSGNECKECVINCSYFYHPNNNGLTSVRELATYVLVCRKCEEPHCVNSCPVEALEQQKEKNKILIRHNMRCVTCRSCSHACPYGTIYPELVPQYLSNCDFCVDRLKGKEEPLCVQTCSYKALSLKSGVDLKLDENTFQVGDNLVIHSTHWQNEKA